MIFVLFLPAGLYQPGFFPFHESANIFSVSKKQCNCYKDGKDFKDH